MNKWMNELKKCFFLLVLFAFGCMFEGLGFLEYFKVFLLVTILFVYFYVCWQDCFGVWGGGGVGIC